MGGMLTCVAQRCLELPREVETLIRGDEVVGAEVEVVVEPVPQLEQDRLEVDDQLSVRYLRDSLSGVNSRPQPYALRAWARRRSSPAATRRPGSPLASGQEVVAKWRAANSASATTSAPDPVASALAPSRTTKAPERSDQQPRIAT